MSSANRAILRAYAAPRFHRDRWYRYYAQAKLATDPMYPYVARALAGAGKPVLDVGCGIGLLAQILRCTGCGLPYAGIDFDARKIRVAQSAAARAHLLDVRFEQRDATAGLPRHHGSVALLDVLQFLPDANAQRVLMDGLIERVAPGGRLVIRTGLADGSSRARTARVVDALSNAWGWMRTAPSNYPEREALAARFAAAGLAAEFSPLSGNTPFNNWLVVATRPA